MNRATRIPVDEIVFDNSNPRIEHYLEIVVNQQKWDRSGPEKIIVMKS